MAQIQHLGLTLDMTLIIYTRVGKGLEFKVRKFSGVIRTFAEVIGEKLISLFPSLVLNRVKILNTFTCGENGRVTH